MGQEVVKELLMQQLNKKNIKKELQQILPEGPVRQKMLKNYEELNRRLGEPGASERFARQIVKDLRFILGKK